MSLSTSPRRFLFPWTSERFKMRFEVSSERQSKKNWWKEINPFLWPALSFFPPPPLCFFFYFHRLILFYRCVSPNTLKLFKTPWEYFLQRCKRIRIVKVDRANLEITHQFQTSDGKLLPFYPFHDENSPFSRPTVLEQPARRFVFSIRDLKRNVLFVGYVQIFAAPAYTVKIERNKSTVTLCFVLPVWKYSFHWLAYRDNRSINSLTCL